jgi:hypothetical protein
LVITLNPDQPQSGRFASRDRTMTAPQSDGEGPRAVRPAGLPGRNMASTA